MEHEEKLLEADRNISVFIEYMKSRDTESLFLARKALKNIKSYSSTRKDRHGYKIRIKCKNEEKIFNYSFPYIYGEFLNAIVSNLNLEKGKTAYLENTGGFLLNYMSQRGLDSLGLTLDENEWEKSVFANFPVFRREYLKRELSPLINGNENLQKVDRLIWIVDDFISEKKFLDEYLKNKDVDIIMLIPVGININPEEYRRNICLDRSLGTEENEFQIMVLSSKDQIDQEETRIPEGLEVLRSNSVILKVDMEKCRDNNGFIYTEAGHYFVETLMQYENNEDLKYEESYLKEYYEKFQPDNRRDNYLWEEGVECFPMDNGWLYDPWRKPAKPPLRKKRFETRKGGNHNLGPNTEEFGHAEFNRLKGAYHALKETGYNPDFFVDGYITGYLLVRKDDYRFVASEGQHRIAALAALGYKSFVCRLDLKPWTNETVFYNQAINWPQVKAGIFTPRVAKMCFEHFFRMDNNKRLIDHLKRMSSD